MLLLVCDSTRANSWVRIRSFLDELDEFDDGIGRLDNMVAISSLSSCCCSFSSAGRSALLLLLLLLLLLICVETEEDGNILEEGGASWSSVAFEEVIKSCVR